MKQTGPQSSAKASAKETYTGISYQLMLIDEDGDMEVVSKSHTFNSGDRIKILAQTNRNGFLTVLNVGSSGKTYVLCNSPVSAFALTEIPQRTNLVFVGDPGEEKIIMMLSDGPNPFGNPGGSPTTQYTSASGYDSPGGSPEGAQAASQNPPSSENYAAPAQDQPMTGVWYANNVEGAKDLVLADRLGTKYAVVSPRNKWKPLPSGKKDIVMESSGGVNYGVIPAASLSGGGNSYTGNKSETQITFPRLGISAAPGATNLTKGGLLGELITSLADRVILVIFSAITRSSPGEWHPSFFICYLAAPRKLQDTAPRLQIRFFTSYPWVTADASGKSGDKQTLQAIATNLDRSIPLKGKQ
ncbi:MAG: hypothetical protein ACYDG4_17870 [Desulfuromonadaceae bacterium]